MKGLPDAELRTLITRDPVAGWRRFIDEHTSHLLSVLEHSGVRDRDDIMDLYALTCERLAADDCAKLKQYDARKGSLEGWLTTVVRRILVDWVRSTKGRKRLFGSIRDLPATDHRVFELFYWRRSTPADIADRVLDDSGRAIGLSAVFASLERIEGALTVRQRGELLVMASRAAGPEPLEGEDGRLVDVPSPDADPEAAIRAAERDAILTSALMTLPAEDRLIVTMRYVDGLTLKEVQRALHLDSLVPARISGILERLRGALDLSGARTDMKGRHA